MPALLNQYSFFVPFALLFAILAVVFAIRRSRRGFALIGAGIIGLGVAAVFLTTPRQTPFDTSSVAAIQSGLASAGRPTLVHFHSHY